MLEHFSDLSADGRAWIAGLMVAFAPPPKITVSEWAAEYRIISRGNAEPGRWRNDRAPYLIEPMDAATDDLIQTLVIAGASQCGKTALGENVVGLTAHLDPCTILWACPSDDSAQAAASRFDAMISDTPVLAERFGLRSARSRVNNLSLKAYEGGRLILASAGSPTSLASHPGRLVVLDEVDRFPISLRKEGDPVQIAKARMTTFARKKLIAMSSPTLKGASRIEDLYSDGDAREWRWKCDCGSEHVPEFENVKWQPGKPDEAGYEMPCCGVVLDDGERLRLMSGGRWIATAEGKPGVRSYRFRGLSSPWLRLADFAVEFEQAKGNPNKLQVLWNTRLGLPYEADTGEFVEAQTVRDLAEDLRADVVPERAALVVAGVDVQASWLALHVVAFGDGDEAWSLQWHEVPGDPVDPGTWEKLEHLLLQTFKHPSGEVLAIEAVAIDAGFQTQSVYEFSQRHRIRGRRWFSTKGMSGAGRPLWQRGGSVSASLGKFFLVGIDGGKAQVMSGIIQADDGPGRWHTAKRIHEAAPHFADWLTAEETVTRDGATGPKVEWRLRRGARRNEAIDTAVLALAARYSFEPNIAARLERLANSGSIKPKVPTMKELAHRMAALTNGVNVNV